MFQGVDPILGIVGNSITLQFLIHDASPDVRPPNIKWQFRFDDGSRGTVQINDSSHYQFSTNRRSLTINNLAHEDEGQYMITVSNEAGSDSLSVNLHIEGMTSAHTVP